MAGGGKGPRTVHIGQWAREGAPLGMEAEVQTSGIFPEVDADEPLEAQMDMMDLAGMRNYESMETARAGGARGRPSHEEVRQRFSQETASKLALILKQKPDGSTKRRIVIDMRRSKGNQRAKVKERIVLPRAQDIVSSHKSCEPENMS